MDRALSIEETAWRTRIRPDLLRALEDEAFDTIGHESFVRSHLSSYARFLGIDPRELVADFDLSLPEPAPSSLEELDRRDRVAKRPPRAKWLIAAGISGVLLVTAAAVGVLGGQSERPAAGLPAEPAAVPTTSAPVPAAEARVRMRIEAVDETQLSVQADGEQVFEGLLRAGQVRTFRAHDALEIIAADGGTIRLAHNGSDLGFAGDEGAVFRGRFGPNGRLGG